VCGGPHLTTGLRLLGDPAPELDIALRVATTHFGLVDLTVEPRVDCRRGSAGNQRNLTIAQGRGFTLAVRALAAVLGTIV
jgi:hypothetical protein